MTMHYMNHGMMLLLGCVVSFNPLHAAPQDEAMARAQFMIRQISAERDQLQADKATLQKQLDELQKKYEGLESKSTKSSGDMKQQFALMREALDAERAAHEASRKQLAETIAEKNRYFDVSGAQAQRLEACIANNHKLHDITRTLLDSYDNKGVWDSLVQTEPLTGISRIEIENLVDDMQYRLDDLRVSAEPDTATQAN